MEKKSSDEPVGGLGLPSWTKWTTVVLVLCAIGVYAFGVRSLSSIDAGTLGTLGDFIGGTLNPVFAFFSFLALLYTINIQLKELALSRLELRLTREELSKSADALESQNETSKRQRFENTLFSMIGVLHQIVADMDVGDEHIKRSGRDCFTEFYVELKRTYIHIGRKDAKSSGESEKNILIHGLGRIELAYDTFYNKRKWELGHYFRVLFNIFRYIDRNEIAEDIYQKMFRAQFSDQELLIIFYNTLSPRGRPLVEYAKKFALFDNLNTERLFCKEHMEQLDPAVFGANPRVLPPEEPGYSWIENWVLP